MKHQAKKPKHKQTTELDDMADLTLIYLEQIATLYPKEFPKLLVLLKAIESGQIDEVAADLRGLLRDFKLTADFSADVCRFIRLVKSKDASAVLEARLEALIDPSDRMTKKARKFVDLYGENGTWAQMGAILSE